MNNVLDGLVDEKIKNILNVFIKNKDNLFHLDKISKDSNIPIATSFRLIRRLVELGFISVIKINKFKVYKLAENKKTELLISIFGAKR